MYELLHPTAPADEYEFYASYATKEMKILEPLCGTGRFLIPLLNQGFDIEGFDVSSEMLAELAKKSPHAHAFQCSMEDFTLTQKYDYIFISSGSFSLFTDQDMIADTLLKMKNSLNENGKFVFAVDTTVNATQNDEFKECCSVTTHENKQLTLKTKNFYDPETKIQRTPNLYELFDGDKRIAQEALDFRLRLYDSGDLDSLIKRAGFKNFNVYTSYDKAEKLDETSDMLLYECE